MLALLLWVAAAAAPEPVTIIRKHAPKQKYALEYKNDDLQLKVSKTFKATAVVKSVADKVTVFDVSVDSMEWTAAGKDKRTASGVKLKVEVNDGAASAEVVSGGTLGDEAEYELTAFEHMLGDLCTPPKGPYYPKQPVVDGSAAWELQYADKTSAKLKSTPEPKADPYTCDVSVALDDGFAGERTGAMRVQLDGKGLNVDQRLSMKAKRL